MSYQSEEIVLNKAARCHDWPLALCGQGDGCHYDHHENLDPASIKKVEYQVSNELGEACERCLNSATEVRHICTCAILTLTRCSATRRLATHDPTTLVRNAVILVGLDVRAY